LLLALPLSVSAHRLDEYLQATLVAIEPNTIRLQINLTPGVAVADKILAVIDHNHDNAISTNEASAYADSLKQDLTLRLDHQNLELRLTVSEFPTPAELRTGSGIIQLEFTATPNSLSTGPHALTLENHHLTTTSVYLFNAVHPKSALIQITAQKRNDNQSAGDIQFSIRPTFSLSSATLSGLAISAIGVLLVYLMQPARYDTIGDYLRPKRISLARVRHRDRRSPEDLV
jgi:hypothetical protein